MKNFFIALMSFIGGAFIITLIILFNLKPDISSHIHIRGFAVTAAAIVSLFIVILIIYASIKSSKDDPFPLGLPDGSVRAIIAVLVLVFFILVSIAIYFTATTNKPEIGSDIVKTLGTLLIAVSAFYFGSKATEQGFTAGAGAAGTAAGQAGAVAGQAAAAGAAAVQAVAAAAGGDPAKAAAVQPQVAADEGSVEIDVDKKSQEDTE